MGSSSDVSSSQYNCTEYCNHLEAMDPTHRTHYNFHNQYQNNNNLTQNQPIMGRTSVVTTHTQKQHYNHDGN